MKRSTICVPAAIVLTGGLAVSAFGQVLNGGFENNSASGTQFNLSNAAYTATVNDSTAFGNAEEIDLIDSSGFGSMVPYQGNWMVGLHRQTNGNRDSLSLTLGTSIVAGNTYTLNFAGAQFDASVLGVMQWGISSSATSLGTHILSATPASDNTWTLYSYTFVAPVNASYLTLSVDHAGGYIFADAVTLTPTPGAAAALALGGATALRRRRR